MIAVTNQKWLNFLEPAFPLPLRWADGQQDNDPRLPESIRECADRVRTTLGASLNDKDAKEAARYRIWFREPMEGWPDLQSLVFPAGSAFASLALGFFSLLNRVTPFESTWASVQWDDLLLPVEDLGKKVDAALRWQAKSFYVAAKQSLDDLNDEQMAIVRRLPNKPGSPSVGLGDYFVAGLVEPDASDAEACLAYHAAIREVDPLEAAKYYLKVLFRHIARKCRERVFVGAGGSEDLPSVMVTIVTHQIEPVTAIIGVLGIRKVLLLYTASEPQMQSKATDLYRQIKLNWPDCQCDEPVGFHFDTESNEFPGDFVASLRSQIDGFLAGTRDTEVAFDIDRGTTLHKLALCKLIRPDHWMTTLVHPMENRKIVHGAERLMLWRAGDDWTRPFCPLDGVTGDGSAE
ncbi:MAG: hypothetical protein EA381_19725 [Planctomycetaceae bacterium]|nr:MAG: hypothetical protein EA381_19725 [Planctomycetaceae bacterium]